MRNGATKEHASRKKDADETTSGGASMVNQSPAEIRERLNEWREILRRETRERPGRSTAIALGAGYLLGGGLFTPLTARFVSMGLRIGLRIAFIPFVTNSLLAMGENLVRGVGTNREGAEDDESSDRSNKNQKRNPDQKETHQ